MPIGVPRIIYCWGEELPAQWTDIYNFIFRRRMIFLMQYLDDELCNQICGLLINIHMEDRSKELEKKEMDKSGLFKSSTKASSTSSLQSTNGGFSGKSVGTSNQLKNSKEKAYGQQDLAQKATSGGTFIKELLTSEEDLAIDENFTLEQYTLQKITMDWLNWNANFFNYNDLTLDEPYLFYLSEILSKDFTKNNGNLLYNTKSTTPQTQGLKTNAKFSVFGSATDKALEEDQYEATNNRKEDLALLIKPPVLTLNKKDLAPLNKFVGIFKSMTNSSSVSKNLAPQKKKENIKTEARFIKLSKKFSYWTSLLGSSLLNKSASFGYDSFKGSQQPDNKEGSKIYALQIVYSPFRFLASIAFNDYNVKNFLQGLKTSSSLFSILRSSFLTSTYPSSVAKGVNSLNTLKPSYWGFTLDKPNMSVKREILKELAKKQLSLNLQTHKNSLDFSKKALGQRTLKREYRQDKELQSTNSWSKENLQYNVLKEEKQTLNLAKNKYKTKKAKNFLDFNYSSLNAANAKNLGQKSGLNSTNTPLVKEFYRKQAERTLQEEESKKVFVIINSFGGSVGNGITVHDALQFIKAGSLTLALGVAASASSLVLAGGTIGERYVTEGCHVMIHQPEGGISGQASDIWIDSAEIMKIRLDVAEIYSLSTYRPRHKILRDLDRDFYLTATETVYYGLADEIATNEVMHEIIEMTSKVWDYHESQQQRLLESRESSTSGLDTQTQN